MTYSMWLFRPRGMDKVELRGCLQTCQTSQATDHEVEHRHADHGFAGLGEILLRFGEAAVTAPPPAGPRHDPAPGEPWEALDACGPLHNLAADFAPGPQRPPPRQQIPRIRTISPEVP